MTTRRCAPYLALFVALAACASGDQAQPSVEPGGADWLRPLEPRPVLRPPAHASDDLSKKPGGTEAGLLAVAPKRNWRDRTALALLELEARDPALYRRLLTVQPNRKVGNELFFAQPELAAAHAAPVLLKRLLNGEDSPAVRLAVVDALPATFGDWQEGAAALVGLDAAPMVRKKLVETLRYVLPPHNITGLRTAFRDEELAVRVAAARTSGFTRGGVELYSELVSGTFDEDWDMRVAAVQSLGQLRVRAAWDRLVRMLSDPHPQVRLQALISLDRIDPAAARGLPDLKRLTTGQPHALAEMARRMLKEQAAAAPAPAPGPAAIKAP